MKRTVENDNDKANSYFKDPQDSMKDKYSAYQLQKIDVGENTKTVASSEGNELIEKLRQQSVDNKDRNDKIIRAKTLQNDMVSWMTMKIYYNMVTWKSKMNELTWPFFKPGSKLWTFEPTGCYFEFGWRNF